MTFPLAVVRACAAPSSILAVAALAWAVTGIATAAGAAAADDEARALAAAGGCRTCHAIEPGGSGPQGMKPIGPAWREVADRYRGQAGAAAQLTRTVLAGSSPYESHWKGKVSGLAMPPNTVVLKEADARRLVDWILALPPAR